MLNIRLRSIIEIAPLRLIAAGLGMLLCLQAFARDPVSTYLKAVRANDTAFLAKMPQLGLDEGSRDEQRNNLLMIAIREENDSFAMALLKQKAWQSKEVLEHENQLGETALMFAALMGSERVTRRLIELGAQVSKPGWTALHYAATSGHNDLIRLLVDKSAYLDAASPAGATPLMMAARFNHRESAKLLLELGADPTLKNQVGMTAKDYAVGNADKDLVFWIELGEVSYMSRFLTGTLKVDPNVSLKDLVERSGGSVQTSRLDSGSSGKGATKSGPLQPVDDTPAEGSSPVAVEVFKGIR